jgi:hypothetical protein
MVFIGIASVGSCSLVIQGIRTSQSDIKNSERTPPKYRTLIRKHFMEALIHHDGLTLTLAVQARRAAKLSGARVCGISARRRQGFGCSRSPITEEPPWPAVCIA